MPHHWHDSKRMAALGTPPAPAVVDGISYHPSGAIASLTYTSGGVTTANTFSDDDHRLSRILTTGPAGPLQDLRYYYDAAGNPITIEDYTGFLSHLFFYDQFHRLTSDFTAGAYAYPLELYGYDDAGNLVQKQNLALGYGASGGGAHGVSEARDPSTGDVHGYQYDVNGNVTSRTPPEGYEYLEHNAANQLGHYTFFGGPTPMREATYTYDESGVRVTRVVTENGATTENVVTVNPELEIDFVRGKVKRHIFIGGRRALTLETPTGASTPSRLVQVVPLLIISETRSRIASASSRDEL